MEGRPVLDPELFKPQLRSRHVKTAEALERERLVLPHLPKEEVEQSPVARFLRTQLYKFVLLLIHTFFSVYLRLRWVYNTVVNRVFAVLYYHHRTPQLIQKDVQELKERGKFPNHVSVILEYEADNLDKLISEVSEIASWCASAGIPKLSVYERTGVLKSYISNTHRAIAQNLRVYFGRSRPSLRVHAPHTHPFVNGDLPDDDAGQDLDIEVVFISEEDGRESLVDLTKTLCDMAQRGKISSDDVSSELVDNEVRGVFSSVTSLQHIETSDSENSLDEPDLLILFSPNIKLCGYPPWQLRLTEIYHVQDNEGVGYQAFLRALHCFARTEMRFGR